MLEFTNKSIDRLLHAITLIENDNEARAFFSDVCTIKELQDLSQRLDVAIALKEGKSYQEIAAQVGTSTATISRVRNCLDYGPGGYSSVINKLKKEENENADK